MSVRIGASAIPIGLASDDAADLARLAVLRVRKRNGQFVGWIASGLVYVSGIEQRAASKIELNHPELIFGYYSSRARASDIAEDIRFLMCAQEMAHG